jgi:hypothetical protein
MPHLWGWWISAAITGVCATLAPQAQAHENFHWVQYVPGGIEVRAITDGTSCPGLTLDGANVFMAVRSSPGENYPITVCSAPLPPGTRKAAIEGVPLPLPVAEPKRILVIGDTGCRLKGKQIQPCNDAALWPFRIGADIGAELKPDLVLHVGDFHYRESTCPDGNDGCAGSPFGDSWAVWRSDFFSPAELLLNASPWILVRGNHEECDRGGKGWARTLDPYPWSSDTGCLGPAQPFVVKLPGISIVVMDVSTADEEKANEKQAAHYRQQFESVRDLVPDGPAWLAFHRPIWTTDGSVESEKSGGDNKTLAAAALGAIPGNVQAFISGHQHKFEVDAYEQDLPIQIVSGHGGDDLSPNPPKSPTGLQVNGMTIKTGYAKPRTFGFSLLERKASGEDWTVTDYDVHGHPLGQCRLSGRAAFCEEMRAGP